MTEPTAEERREINRRIAELEGWTDLHENRDGGWWLGRTPAGHWSPILHYCGDLNEMHRLEMGLDYHQYRKWKSRVEKAMRALWNPEETSEIKSHSAPAWVRAKEYLEVVDERETD